MILYHFATSPFARRVRLALAHKGLVAELRDPRANTEYRVEVQRLNPMHTVPVLVDDGRVVPHANAISQYLDRKWPAPPLYPPGLEGAEAFEWIAHVDSVLNVLSDLGARCAALHEASSFPAVREELVGRVQRTLDVLATKVTATDRWTAGEHAVFTMVVWLENLPERAKTFPPAKSVVSLGWSLPPALSRWADAHRERPDVVALG